jgi:6-phosphogluconolactonase (cycloisomerase 2 family)
MAVEPRGKFLYLSNQDGQIGGLSTYGINQDTGAVTTIGLSDQTFEQYVATHAAGIFMFDMGRDGSVGVNRINPASGALTFVSGISLGPTSTKIAGSPFPFSFGGLILFSY